MLLAGVLLKIGTYGLILFLPLVKLNHVLLFYFRLSLLGAIVCSIICLRQGDIKVLIAYSSIVHMGVVLLGLLSCNELGYSCGLIMVTAHGLRSPFVFRMAFWIYSSTHSRMITNNTRAWPVMVGMLAGLVSLNIRVPPRLRL